MFNSFFKLTLLFLLGISLNAHSTTVDLHRVVYVKHTVKHPNTSTISRPSGRFATIDLLMGQNGAAHLTSQNYRPSHFVKHAAVFNAFVFVIANCSKYISRSGQVSFSRFRKLVLFPFHAFWWSARTGLLNNVQGYWGHRTRRSFKYPYRISGRRFDGGLNGAGTFCIFLTISALFAAKHPQSTHF